MNERPANVLLIDDGMDDICLIEEALSEIEEVQFSHPWIQPCRLLQADQVSEALGMMSSGQVDVVLLDLTVPDAHGLDALRRVQDPNPDTPVVILADTKTETTAMSLVRQGAQDYLLKEEIDCLPLARVLRCAMERQRVRSSLRTLSFIDDLTGLYSEGGFYNLAAKHWKLAGALGRKVGLHLYELSGLKDVMDTFGIQERDMSLILAAEILRKAYRETDIVGRVSRNLFAAVTIHNTVEDTKPVPRQVVRSILRSNARRGRPLPNHGAAV